MTIIFLLLGALVGASVADDHGAGALFGAVLGFMAARSIALRSRVRELEIKLAALGKAVRPAEAVSATSAPEAASFDPVGAPLEMEQPVVAMPAESAASPEVDADFREESIDAAAPEAIPRRRNPLSSLTQIVTRYFTGGNAAVRIGVILLFFGVAFLFKYAAERNVFPIELRLAAVALGGIALLIVGWRLRRRNGDYGLVLQGGGIGLIYMTAFVALRMYGVVPAPLAFALMVALVGLAALLAVLQDSRALAVTSVVGGFLAPILASTNSGNHVLLFSYYSVLNAGIFAIAWYKSWRLLNLIGFVFTFAIASLWGYQAYRPEFFASTEPFLLASFFFYSLIAVLTALRQSAARGDYIDAALVFGTPLIVFALQSRLVAPFDYALAYTALGMSLFYLVIARIVLRRQPQPRMLVESFIALGTIFATLAVPLAFGARWTAAAWAIEGAGIVWVGVRQNRMVARLFGAALQLLAGIAFILSTRHGHGQWAFIDGIFLGAMTISIASMISSYHVWRNRATGAYDQALEWALLGWGVIWWIGGGLAEIEAHMPAELRIAAIVQFSAGSALIWMALSAYFKWAPLAIPALGVVLLWALALGFATETKHHPFADRGYIAWPLAFVIYYWMLYRSEYAYRFARFGHAIILWMLTLVLSWEAGWAVREWIDGAPSWQQAMWGLIPAVMLGVIHLLRRAQRWPVGPHADDYRGLIALPIAGYLAVWSLFTSLTSSADAAPLIYLPFINPLDLAHFAVIVALLVTVRGVAAPQRVQMYGVLGLVTFVWLSAVLVRTLHHWYGVPYTPEALMASNLVQASVSIFWSLIAFALMFLATRRAARVIWLVGAVLLGIVVVKLFVVDLDNSGTIARIITFISVGILLVLVGYVSPVPPRRVEVRS